MMKPEHQTKLKGIKWSLLLYDLAFSIVCAYTVYIVYPSFIDLRATMIYMAIGILCVFTGRLLTNCYRRIWRYAGPPDYLMLVISDTVAGILYLLMRPFIPKTITVLRATSFIAINLIGAISMRLVYQGIYQHRSLDSPLERFCLRMLKLLTGVEFPKNERLHADRRIRIAVVGAGSIGVMLAEELQGNARAMYQPVCFVDVNAEKVGRSIAGIPVIFGEAEDLADRLNAFGVQEVVFALPNINDDKKSELYAYYKKLGYKIKAYDYPAIESAESGRRQLRDFAIEDLLFRRVNKVADQKTVAWYHGKVVMITGGGGSIGSELARQIAKAGPSRLILLDIYENGVYDIQQELKIKFGSNLNMRVEIANICDREQLDRIFFHHTPDIVLHAAAHKHVPLMERNCCEAVKNNVFGTLNLVELCEKYGVSRFIMISTDKAVNPTNVMGATKRMCEMIVQSRTGASTVFSATRFGNVLGSNGSVIPLFKRQIAGGGPVTVTDKRIIRYFMTIPEACQLVMTSGTMAKNGDLYALDMGKPVKILELAENMIRLSGLEPYKDINIVETGLRPGEKLYEELLIKTEDLDKTENEHIYVERDKPLSPEEIDAKLEILRSALATESNRAVKQALMDVVPTYRKPEEVNRSALEAEEMQIANGA